MKHLIISLVGGISCTVLGSQELILPVAPQVFLGTMANSTGSIEASRGVATRITVPGNAALSRLSERSERTALQYPAVSSDGLTLQETIFEMDGYSRSVLSITNTTDSAIQIAKIVFADNTPITGAATMTKSGAGAGSVLISDSQFMAIEHPMGVVSFTNPTIPALEWTQEHVPTGSGNSISQRLQIEQVFSGTITVTFNYKAGNRRLDISKVEALATDGTVLATDEHTGYSGTNKSNHIYTLTLADGVTTSAFRCTYIGEANSNGPNAATRGEIAIVSNGVTATAAPLSGVDNPITVSMYLPRNYAIKAGECWTVSAVVGNYAMNQMRRDFMVYLNSERAHPFRILPHYNSWYDLNINRKDNTDETTRFSKYDGSLKGADSALDAMKAFHQKLTVERGISINSYLFDDGWDSWNSLWDFNAGFTNGFHDLAKEAHKVLDASIGCWMSPFGGYGTSNAKRVEYAKTIGAISTNSTSLKMAEPVYYNAFRDRCLSMINDYDMNLFKFDRMGGGQDADGSNVGLSAEMEAVLNLTKELREAQPDVFINATVGTWPSPFWTFYADSIWRGGNDHGMTGTGSSREKWITYRDNIMYDRFTKNNPLFPLNSMMMHGIIVCTGSAGNMDITDSAESTLSYANEVWMAVALGTGLQEYYITPDLMHETWWDILADAISWMMPNRTILEDSHWIGGDPGSDEVYGYASLGASKGIVILRNPSATAKTFSAKLDTLLETPSSKDIAKIQLIYSSDSTYSLPVLTSTGDDYSVEIEPYGVRLFEVQFVTVAGIEGDATTPDSSEAVDFIQSAAVGNGITSQDLTLAGERGNKLLNCLEAAHACTALAIAPEFVGNAGSVKFDFNVTKIDAVTEPDAVILTAVINVEKGWLGDILPTKFKVKGIGFDKSESYVTYDEASTSYKREGNIGTLKIRAKRDKSLLGYVITVQ